MDASIIAVFVLSTFVGGIVSGLAGFAFGLVVSGLWLQIITPLETTTLIVSYALLLQAYGLWRLRHSFNWPHVIPMLIGSAVGSPIGVWLLHLAHPLYLRLGVGILLVAYSLYGLLRPALKPLPTHVPGELILGLFNGLLGGMTGLSGILVTVWCSMRGWSKDEQRAVYQPVLFASAIMTAITLVAGGAVTVKVMQFFAIGLPVLGAGMLLGFALYYRVDDAMFRRIVLVLLLLSGLALIVPQLV
jgi:uncharacterized protein